jgi:phosphate starvation-inducible PhoH-like protein
MSNTVDKTLEFENAHFLQSLFGNDLAQLKLVERALDVKVSTRDAWIKFEGSEDGVRRAVGVFGDLELARRDGADIGTHAFKFAVERAALQSTDVMRKDGGDLKELLSYRLLGSRTKPAVSPKTQGQLEYLKAMGRNDVVFGVGPAGTGKTYLAMAAALSALKAKEVNRLILTRPAVEAGEALGFLPGDLKDKVLPYLRPLYDALYDMIEPDEVEKFIERGMIEIAPLAYMRGRTLNNSAIILDEAQNTTCEQMFMFLTRLGGKSRCIITGDPSQNDLKGRQKSGLTEAMEILPGTESIEFVKFEKRDVVRHPVVARIIHAYERARGSGED